MARDTPGSDAMERIESTVDIGVPVEDVFAYYADPASVIRMTPPELHLKIVKADTPLRQGARVAFYMRPRMLPFEFRWDLMIRDFVLNQSFSEVLERGPFALWRHEHRFLSLDPGRSRVTDTIVYDRPLGFAGQLLGASFVKGMLHKMFQYRERVLREDLEQTGVKVERVTLPHPPS